MYQFQSVISENSKYAFINPTSHNHKKTIHNDFPSHWVSQYPIVLSECQTKLSLPNDYYSAKRSIFS